MQDLQTDSRWHESDQMAYIPAKHRIWRDLPMLELYQRKTVENEEWGKLMKRTVLTIRFWKLKMVMHMEKKFISSIPDNLLSAQSWAKTSKEGKWRHLKLLNRVKYNRRCQPVPMGTLQVKGILPDKSKSRIVSIRKVPLKERNVFLKNQINNNTIAAKISSHTTPKMILLVAVDEQGWRYDFIY